MAELDDPGDAEALKAPRYYMRQFRFGLYMHTHLWEDHDEYVYASADSVWYI